MKNWIATAVVFVALATATVVAGRVEQESASRDSVRWPAQGRAVTLADGTILNIACSGLDSPTTVVFEAGLGESSMTWSDVLPDVAETTRACAYDRAGYGWSAPTSASRDARTEAAQLHEALEGVGEAGPYLLVAHSLGGLVSRQFAAVHPHEVMGLVLLDPTDPGAVLEAGAPVLPVAEARVQSALARVGALRPFLGRLVRDASGSTPPAAVEERAALLYTFRTFDTAAAELGASLESARQIEESGPLKGIPVAVLASTGSIFTPEQLAQISDESTVVNLQSGHYLHYEHPTAVIDTIRGILASP